MKFELRDYLRRIGSPDIAVTAQGLAALQEAQMRSIAFENIDVFLGEIPGLDEASLWEKLILRRRGGYCLELNGLFGQALEALGFAARPILGRVRMGAPRGGPRSHHAWIVTVEGVDYLADAGFGGPASSAPLRLDDHTPQPAGGEIFRIREDYDSGERVVERKDDGGWFALYGFDEARIEQADLVAANVVCSRWEASPFPANLMMTRRLADGRVSLFNRTLKTVASGRAEARTIESEAGLTVVLRDKFGLSLADDFLSRLWRRLNTAGDLRHENAA